MQTIAYRILVPKGTTGLYVEVMKMTSLLCLFGVRPEFTAVHPTGHKEFERIGNPTTDLEELLRRIRALAGKPKPPLVYVHNLATHPVYFGVESDRIKAALNYRESGCWKRHPLSDIEVGMRLCGHLVALYCAFKDDPDAVNNNFVVVR